MVIQMTNVPVLQTQDDYDEWIDELTEQEYDEFVDYFDDLDDIDLDDVKTWVNEAPFTFTQSEIIDQYRQIMQYTGSYYTEEMLLSLPSDDPLDVAYHFAVRCIRLDVEHRLGTLLDDRTEFDF